MPDNGVLNCMEKLKKQLAQAVEEALGVDAEQLGFGLCSLFETPEDEKMGDIALPCFRLAKVLRKSPAAIAADAASRTALPDGIERADAVNGYLNFFISPSFYSGKVAEILADPDFG